ncbi:CAP domain-containing protein [Clostridium perfringens]|uniref:CAP domain-containing protein n=1 Tax=Clostridium perfringens TaxID=1502 RepID=UPI001F061DA0|nr:CAP domain-containing protein [Clostridium perfringens]MCH1964591.1 CAP domain-containing protein [Clostridium perfringens]
MNKRIKAIIEFVKVHKKETIGVAVALGIAVVGVGGYAISKHYANNDTNNIALAEKKEDPKTDEDKKLEENKAADNEDATMEEKDDSSSSDQKDIEVEQTEDGNTIIKDKSGNIIADSSKGDDVQNVISDKKESGSSITIKNDKTGKVEKVESIKGQESTSEGTITIVKPNKEPSSNNQTESKPQEKPEESKPQETPQPSPKPEESKPVEKPQPEEKPQEQPKPEEKPVATVQYMDAMTQQLWSEFNAYRQSKGLNPLKWSGKYAGWTKSHCEEMAKKEGGSYHKDYPEGGQVTGMNGGNMNASSILQQFKNSPAHNANLLDDELTEGACAIYRSKDGTYYFVIGFDY